MTHARGPRKPDPPAGACQVSRLEAFDLEEIAPRALEFERDSLLCNEEIVKLCVANAGENETDIPSIIAVIFHTSHLLAVDEYGDLAPDTVDRDGHS